MYEEVFIASLADNLSFQETLIKFHHFQSWCVVFFHLPLSLPKCYKKVRLFKRERDLPESKWIDARFFQLD